MSEGKKILITEVGPRDGFQNIDSTKKIIPTEVKIRYIERLISAGVKSIQYTSFVSPKAIPQLADAQEVTANILPKYPDLDLFALVPNFRGAKDAVEAGLKKVAYVVSFSKSHNLANINRTHDQSLAEFKEIRARYPNLQISLNFATTFGCPFEGKYENDKKFINFVKDYYEAGMTDAVLCDTIGIADPEQVRRFIRAFKAAFPKVGLTMHFHDTRGLGMVNSFIAIDEGVTRLESTLGGLGGCPFAPGASGNLSTEDLIWALTSAGYDTGISFSQLVALAKEEHQQISGIYSGHQLIIQNPTPPVSK
ncbi:MAG: hydroxymethylglutaryl-CoA lyase [Peptoniphilaceae bacterium]|nr:hydroxymethylglutaryl-CoA lyase [Peptoniphilaceae bacterium]